jgi:hypothetical protein
MVPACRSPTRWHTLPPSLQSASLSHRVESCQRIVQCRIVYTLPAFNVASFTRWPRLPVLLLLVLLLLLLLPAAGGRRYRAHFRKSTAVAADHTRRASALFYCVYVCGLTSTVRE